MTEQHADLAIVGGGIAGLWTLHRALAAGYNAVLFEADNLGGQQTLASQGMIHGGVKYTLGAALTGASEAIAGMPERWQACLDGSGEVDLRGLTPLSERYYLFANRSTLGKLTGFFASRALRGRVEPVAAGEFPAAFRGFDGLLYQMHDIVLDCVELMSALAAPVQDRLYRARIDGRNCVPSEAGFTLRFDGQQLNVRQVVCCAGEGAELLQQALGMTGLLMQRRPLRQVIVRAGLEAPIFAHCLTNLSRLEPRLTITTHDGTLYIGGRIASEGAERSHDDQITKARAELALCLPWLNLTDAEFDTLYIDRAEPRQEGALRPDRAYAQAEGRFIQCWPTKLTLAPDAADQVLKLLQGDPRGGNAPTLQLPRPVVGALPW